MAKRANLKDELTVKEREEPRTYIPPKARQGKVMMNVLVAPEARDMFKSITSRNGTTVQAKIREFMNSYFEENGEKPIA